eukprot:TRINITY_DN84356_c0_g1_i1.p4 TRINITY_DN84356_c0_g1~~TRINITY_DN84356_c0_g1_i1.p4  ORF type:complete len:102 (+),score=1.88 TRINITY_DN84356_c0_g1_i1:97-402(+)
MLFSQTKLQTQRHPQGECIQSMDATKCVRRAQQVLIDQRLYFTELEDLFLVVQGIRKCCSLKQNSKLKDTHKGSVFRVWMQQSVQEEPNEFVLRLQDVLQN